MEEVHRAGAAAAAAAAVRRSAWSLQPVAVLTAADGDDDNNNATKAEALVGGQRVFIFSYRLLLANGGALVTNLRRLL